ncbi:MAG: hypothetical protein L3J71_01545 [Victivallaceae bacterium]|nr:hypothetical protein [Victivallaceae bacterium]
MNKNKLAKQGKMNLPQRYSIRFKEYDYSQAGYYFTTICTQNKQFPNGQPQTGQPQGIAPTVTTNTVGNIIGAFQSIVTVEYIRGVNNENWQRFNGKLWQRNYWEHIIRNENEYLRISQYITNNPKKWALDKLNGGTGNMVMEEIAEYNSEIWMI